MHSYLKRMGLLDYRARQERLVGAEGPMFPNLSRNTRGHIGAKPSRWWRDYLTAIGVKAGRDGKGAHSFRHTLADRLRVEAELLNTEIAVCLGHGANTTTAGYGAISEGTARKLSRWIENVTFSGVSFDHLFTSNEAQASSVEPTEQADA